MGHADKPAAIERGPISRRRAFTALRNAQGARREVPGAADGGARLSSATSPRRTLEFNREGAEGGLVGSNSLFGSLRVDRATEQR